MVDPGAINADPGAIKADPGAIKADPGAIKVNSRAIKAHPGIDKSPTGRAGPHEVGRDGGFIDPWDAGEDAWRIVSLNQAWPSLNQA